MKRIRLLVISGFMALSLTACRPSFGHLPAGGKEVNYKTEEGQKQIRESLDKTVEAYKQEVSAMSVKADLRNTSLTVKGRVGSEEKPVAELDMGVTKLGGKAELNLKNVEGKTIGNAKLQDFGMNVLFNGKIYGDEKTISFDDKLSISRVGAETYLQNSTLYADYSGKAFRKALDSVSAFASKIAKETAAEGKEPEQYDLNKTLDEATGVPERKISVAGLEYSVDSIYGLFKLEKISDEDFKAAMNYIEKVDFVSFKAYSDGRYGLEASLTKEVMKDLVAIDAESEEEAAKTQEEFDKAVKEFSVNAAALFGKDARLAEVSYSANVKVEIQMGEVEGFLSALSGTDFEIVLKSEGALDFAYNDDVKVKMLSESQLAQFKPVVVQSEEPEEAGE